MVDNEYSIDIHKSRKICKYWNSNEKSRNVIIRS